MSIMCNKLGVVVMVLFAAAHTVAILVGLIAVVRAERLRRKAALLALAILGVCFEAPAQVSSVSPVYQGGSAQSRKAVDIGGFPTLWQSIEAPFREYSVTATGAWTVAKTAGIDLTILPTSGSGNGTFRVRALDRFTTTGTRTATITVSGAASSSATATYTLDVRAKQPQAHGGPAPGCTNINTDMYSVAATCPANATPSTAWTSTGTDTWLDNSTGRTIIKVATGEGISYASKRAICGDYFLSRETTGASRTRVRRVSTGAIVSGMDSLSTTHEFGDWAPDCSAIFYVGGVAGNQIYRIPLGQNTGVLVADYSPTGVAHPAIPGGCVQGATGVAAAMFTGGTYSISSQGWYAVGCHLTGRATHDVACLIQVQGLSTATQTAQTHCLDMSTYTTPLGYQMAYLKNIGISDMGVGGVAILHVGDVNGEKGKIFCDFNGTSAPTNCRRIEAPAVFSSTQNDDGVVQANEGAWIPAHEDLAINPLTKEPEFWIPIDEYRNHMGRARLRNAHAMQPLEAGGGLLFDFSTRAEGTTGVVGSEIGCEGHLCFITRYGYQAADWTLPHLGRLLALDMRDNTLHLIAATPMAIAFPTTVVYAHVVQPALSRDGCWALFSTSIMSSAAADISIYKVATGLCKSQPTWTEQRGLSVNAGAAQAVIKYNAPSDAACTVALSVTDPSVLSDSYHADTVTPASDSRAGSISNGRARQFLAGSVSALAAGARYYYRIRCGALWDYTGSFRTREPGAGGATFAYSTAVAGEVSTSADMSSPNAIPSSATHTVAVPSGVRYYRRTGGPIQVVP